jgi:hypothetical protein
MKQIVSKSLMFLFVACMGLAGVQLAHACYQCTSGGANPECTPGFSAGAEICVQSSDPPFCTPEDNDCCQGTCGCEPCNGGCCASLKGDNKHSCAAIRRMAQETTAPIPPEVDKVDHLKDFLANADRGKFDGKLIFMHKDGRVANELMKLPLDQWKSFTERIVLKGEPHISPGQGDDSKPKTVLEIETKTGHKVVILLQDEVPIKDAPEQPQAKSQKPNIEGKL